MILSKENYINLLIMAITSGAEFTPHNETFTVSLSNGGIVYVDADGFENDAVGWRHGRVTQLGRSNVELGAVLLQDSEQAVKRLHVYEKYPECVKSAVWSLIDQVRLHQAPSYATITHDSRFLTIAMVGDIKVLFVHNVDLALVVYGDGTCIVCEHFTASHDIYGTAPATHINKIIPSLSIEESPELLAILTDLAGVYGLDTLRKALDLM